MPLNLQDIARLRQTLALFDIDTPLDVVGLEPESIVRRYLQQFSFAQIPAAAYHLGYVNFPGELAVWGKLACHLWRAPNVPARGTICLAPGLFDHAGLFQPLIVFWLRQGFDLVCLEMPGHGLSDGQDCAVDSFFTYGALWSALLSLYQNQLAQPFIGVGQSTGCTALTTLTLAKQHYFSQLIFFAPLVRPQKWWQLKLAFLLLHKILTKTPRQLRNNSHATEFNQLLLTDVLQPKFLSVRWAAALYEWVNVLPQLPQSNTPLLILQGTGDKVVDWRYNITQLQQHFTQSQVVYLEHAMHHLANEGEPWRGKMAEAIKSFIDGKK